MTIIIFNFIYYFTFNYLKMYFIIIAIIIMTKFMKTTVITINPKVHRHHHL